MATDEVTIRRAVASDTDVLVKFARALALETEGRELPAERVQRGVSAVFENSARGAYFVAERAGEVVACCGITFEWSDWRAGQFWWVQTVYVAPDHRRQGVFTKLYKHVESAARGDDTCCGLRLYVDDDNESAQRVYTSLGMVRTMYQLFETDFVMESRA